MTSLRTRSRARNSHDDAPDTTAEFQRVSTMREGPEKEALRQEIVRAWMPMAERIAVQFRNRGESAEDLRQVALLGLVKAVRRYDPERGSAFASYAVPTVTGELRRHFRDHTWDLHVPRRVQDARNRVRTAVRDLSTAADDRGPEVGELARRTGMTDEEVRVGLQAMESYSALSLDAQLTSSDSGYTLADTIGSTEPAYERVVQREALKPRLRALPEREKRILYLRFFCDETQNQIADELGISQMHVSRLISRTCERLSQQIEADAA